MAEFRTYRDRNTGIVREYPVSLAKVFLNLEEVDSDAKPLAYVPIPRIAVEEYLASASESDAESSDEPQVATVDAIEVGDSRKK